jgi:LysM repeat protein
MGRARWVLLASWLLAGTVLACLSASQDEEIELKPTLILTPYATVTPTPTPTPLQSPTPTTTPTPETDTYVVKAGDTLSGIAARYGISTRDLMRLNGLSDGDLLTVGQKLKVPKR